MVETVEPGSARLLLILLDSPEAHGQRLQHRRQGSKMAICTMVVRHNQSLLQNMKICMGIVMLSLATPIKSRHQ